MEIKMGERSKEIMEDKSRDVFLYLATPWKELTEEQQKFLVKYGFYFPDGEMISRYIDPISVEYDSMYPYFLNFIYEGHGVQKEHIKWALIKFNTNHLTQFFCKQCGCFSTESDEEDIEEISEEDDIQLGRLVGEIMNELSIDDPNEYQRVMEKMTEVCGDQLTCPGVVKCIQALLKQ